MSIIEITSLDTPELRPFFSLTDAQLRSRQRPEDALVVAEGPKVVGTALGAGLRPVAMLMRRKMIGGAGSGLIRMAGETPVYTADDDTLAALTGFRLQRAWVLCAFRRPPERRAPGGRAGGVPPPGAGPGAGDGVPEEPPAEGPPSAGPPTGPSAGPPSASFTVSAAESKRSSRESGAGAGPVSSGAPSYNCLHQASS